MVTFSIFVLKVSMKKSTPISITRTPPYSFRSGAQRHRLAARRMRETFGLSIFGFDLIVDSASGDTMVIDVNFFPSFKDLHDFPQVGAIGAI